MFNYWQQPRPIRWFIRQFIPKRDEWEITARKHEHGDWVFDIPPFVKDEALTGGTETIIDEYYRQLNNCEPGTGNTIVISVTQDKPEYYHAVCESFASCISGFGRIFVERNTQMVGWLCGMEEYMFKNTPQQIYVTFKSTCTDDEFFKFITGRDINSI